MSYKTGRALESVKTTVTCYPGTEYFYSEKILLTGGLQLKHSILDFI